MKPGQQLLVEYLPFKVDRSLIRESIDRNGGKLIVSGVLQRANAKNQNQRIYPRAILEREVNRYLSEEVANARALGELDHSEKSSVDLRNTSHNILKMEWKGDDLYGIVEILPTPSGNILKALFESNITVGISSRGVGSVKPINEGDDTMEVQNDFSIICWDFVSTPSTHGAFMKPMNTGVHESLNESLQDYTKDSKVNSLIHDIICSMSGTCCIGK